MGGVLIQTFVYVWFLPKMHMTNVLPRLDFVAVLPLTFLTQKIIPKSGSEFSWREKRRSASDSNFDAMTV